MEMCNGKKMAAIIVEVMNKKFVFLKNVWNFLAHYQIVITRF